MPRVNPLAPHPSARPATQPDDRATPERKVIPPAPPLPQSGPIPGPRRPGFTVVATGPIRSSVLPAKPGLAARHPFDTIAANGQTKPPADRLPTRTQPPMPHHAQLAAYQLGAKLAGEPVAQVADRARLFRANETMHETRTALDMGRGNMQADVEATQGRSAALTQASYLAGIQSRSFDAGAGAAMAARAGACDHHGALNSRHHGKRMPPGEQVRTVTSDEIKHTWSVVGTLQTSSPAASASPAPVVMDSWATGPAVLQRHSQWHATKTRPTEPPMSPVSARAALDRTTEASRFYSPGGAGHAAFNLHVNAGMALMRDYTPPYNAETQVIRKDLASKARLALDRMPALSQEIVAAGAAREALGMRVGEAALPSTTGPILDAARRLDALTRPPLRVSREAPPAPTTTPGPPRE